MKRMMPPTTNSIAPIPVTIVGSPRLNPTTLNAGSRNVSTSPPATNVFAFKFPAIIHFLRESIAFNMSVTIMSSIGPMNGSGKTK